MWLQLIFNALSVLIKILRPGGVKSVMAENTMLKQQLLVLNRNQNKAPKLTTSERFIFGFLTAFISSTLFQILSVIIKPATLLKFHMAFIKRIYLLLFCKIYGYVYLYLFSNHFSISLCSASFSFQ